MNTHTSPRARTRRFAGIGAVSLDPHLIAALGLTPAEIDALETTTARGLQDEIDMLRAFMLRTFKSGRGAADIHTAIAILRALDRAGANLNRLVRTQFLLDQSAELDRALREALLPGVDPSGGD